MPQEYIIYGAVAFIFIVFLIVSIRPKKKQKLYDIYEAIYKMEPESELETVTVYQSFTKTDEEDKEKVVQLSLFHENYKEEIKGLKTLADEPITTEIQTEDTEDIEIEEVETIVEEDGKEPLTRDDLRKLRLVELKEVAKVHNLKGYSRMRKAELIEFIIEHIKR